jgi:predicted glycogen debranching enzyme
MISFDRTALRDVETSFRREWLETNGIGGFASSTIAGIHTRRYHGLLTAAIHPPVGRYLLVAKLEEILCIGNTRTELSSNRYPGIIYPEGHKHLCEFRLDPYPVFTYRIEELEVEKCVFMVHGENTTVVEYSLRNLNPSIPALLEIRPLIAFRDYHSLTHKNDGLNSSLTATEGHASIAPYAGLPQLHFHYGTAALEKTGIWYFNFEYDRERERGLDFREDLYSPLTLTFDLRNQTTVSVVVSTEAETPVHASILKQREVHRRQALLSGPRTSDSVKRQLFFAADQFIVQRSDLHSVIAGYHWFSDWTRDAMISLPGLTLATGRIQIARNILLAFAGYADGGMLPNRFPDVGAGPEYNNVDGTLWFFEAVRLFLSQTGDFSFVMDRLYPLLTDILDWHIRGTRYNIHVDVDALLICGEPGTQLTWMDAKVGDYVVTPRYGKPVEVEALWYNALCFVRELAEAAGHEDALRRYGTIASAAKQSFNRLFWNAAENCLYDVVNGSERDASFRPNQIIAVSLPNRMLGRERAAMVVESVERHLLTPYGLRTLSPSDPRYRPTCEGDAWSRDTAYHQGTVWPWLIGPFIRAYLYVHGSDAAARQQATVWLQPLMEHLLEAGLGQISEIFDGDPPHHPRGCIAQAWSVGELLRNLMLDLAP